MGDRRVVNAIFFDHKLAQLLFWPSEKIADALVEEVSSCLFFRRLDSWLINKMTNRNYYLTLEEILVVIIVNGREGVDNYYAV